MWHRVARWRAAGASMRSFGRPHSIVRKRPRMPKIWKLPTYRFTLPTRKIVVNVTRSCPTFSVAAPGVPDIAANLRHGKMMRILDFGAGKLRNSLFLLSQKAGFKVWAVEFKDCFVPPAGKQRLAEAKSHKNF